MRSSIALTLCGINILIALTGCAENNQTSTMYSYAESYVKLVLALGEHDAAYVDAYYGPSVWLVATDRQQRSWELLELLSSPRLPIGLKIN